MGANPAAAEVEATTTVQEATTSTAPSTTSTPAPTTTGAGSLFAADLLNASGAHLWTGQSSGFESATVGFLVNIDGCIGLTGEPGTHWRLPVRFGTFGDIYVAVTPGGAGIDFNGTVIEFGTYINIGGAVQSTHAREGEDTGFRDGIRQQLENATAACGLEFDTEGWYFDAALENTPYPIEYVPPDPADTL
ncbi:MAG: hypothetical protein GY708_09375 [Actinomycetia bacterium]|nr:hypothetical protein [Actinomycetes bacterium]